MPIRILALFFFCGLASALAQSAQTPPGRSIVYSAHDPAAIKDYRTDPAVVRAMVNRLVLAVTGQTGSGARLAFARFAGRQDRHQDFRGRRRAFHHPSRRGQRDRRWPGRGRASRSSIIVWDRSLGGIKEAGYRPGAEGYQMKSIAPRDGYDPKAIFTAPLTGKLIWGDLDYRTDQGTVPLLSDQEQTSDQSHFSRIVSSEVTKIINVPVMSDSSTNGLAGCLYNVTIPNIDNWRRFTQVHGYGGAAIADLYNNPLIGKKVVLNLMDGLAAQYAGGPQSQPNYAVHHATLLASKDPVAIDAIALQRIEQWREKAKLPPIGRLAAHVQIAGQVGIGNADLARIEVRNVDR